MQGMMYLAALPVTISMRSSNPARAKRTTLGAMVSEAHHMLRSDLFWLFVPWVVIAGIESSAFEYPSFTAFHALFEVSSSLGTVGLSLGAGNGAVTSFSARLSAASQWVMMLVMLVGRNRGLPDDSEELLALEALYRSSRERPNIVVAAMAADSPVPVPAAAAAAAVENGWQPPSPPLKAAPEPAVAAVPLVGPLPPMNKRSSSLRVRSLPVGAKSSLQ